MHWIQREILKTLSTAESCRYIDLKPKNVDGNLFMYHLKQLMSAKYVKSSDKKYSLTKEGKRFVAGLSLKTGQQTKTPRLFVMIFCQKEGNLLLYKWSRQPYFNHISLPFSRIRYGQNVQTAAEETLKYKTGLSGKLERVGEVSVIVNKKDEITTHYLAHLYKFNNPNGELSADGLTGQPFWGDIVDFDSSDFVNGTKEIIYLLKTKKSPFFEEIFVKK